MTTTADARSLRGPGLPATTTREDRLAAAHQLLADGVAQLTNSDAWTRMLTTAARFPSYSFNNLILILTQRPDATRVAGMRLWNSLGRTVNKGERGIRILAPITRKHTDDLTGDTEHRICGFTVVSVFDQSQTSGADLDPHRPHLLTGDAPDGLLDMICAQITLHDFTVTFGDCGTANGITSWLTRTVTIRADLSPLQTVKTALHELGHVLAHSPDDPAAVLSCRGTKEVEAESIAYIVAHTLGLDTSTYSFSYVAHWAEHADTSTDIVQATAETVIRHARTILNDLQR